MIQQPQQQNNGNGNIEVKTETTHPFEKNIIVEYDVNPCFFCFIVALSYQGWVYNFHQ
jgi:hypothetical protein